MNDSSHLYLSVLPIRNIIVTLKFTDKASPRFFHQIELSSLLKYWLHENKLFEQHFRIDCPETGQTNYHKGDYYRFSLYSLGNCDAHLQTLLSKLQALPSTAPVIDRKVAFRNNLVLHSLQDGFNENPITDVSELSCYDEESLQQEVTLWEEYQQIRFRFISPARLLKEKNQRKNLKGEARFCRDSSDTSIDLLLSRLHDRFAEFSRNSSAPGNTQRNSPPETKAVYTHLFWLDNHYTDMYAKSHVIGGMTGLIEFSFTQKSQATNIWPLLILGQFTGIGQSTSFGYGRYLLETINEGVTHRRCLPAQSLLMRAAESENLLSAYRHILQNSTHPKPIGNDPGTDVEDDKDTDDTLLQQLKQKLIQIQQQQYHVPELKGVLLDKSNGGVRALAIPPFTDRVLQRALAQIITPTLEKLFYQRSYGYRPGKSRLTAKENIQLAWRLGYRWVYESDIEDFFNSVNLQRLKERMIALYDNDAAIQGIINWMSAPVRFERELIERNNGLPQGSPLSPLLANLMLDDFDSDMRDAGFMLIRYADDFIVLCKDQEQAIKADLAARKSLSEHGFKLNQSKTHIKTMEQGFKYLGYLFVNDIALDIGSKTTKETKLTKPAQSWLINLSAKTPDKIKQKDITKLVDQWSQCKTLHCNGERDSEGTLICLTGANSIITTSAKQMQIHRDDKLLYNLPWHSLQAVILFGNHHITTPAMQAAMQASVPVHFASRTGKYHGTLWNAQPAIYSYELWQQQIENFNDSDNALYAAKQIVNARLIHMKETLRQRKINTNTTAIDNSIRTLHQCQSLSSLMGKEGNATKVYFQLLKKIIPDEFEFTGRNRRPPQDPFNAMLSLGYTMLYGYTESILRASGLLPWAGFYHQSRGKHAALASDLMEPFRHLIERTALTLICQQTLKTADFTHTSAGACLLTDKARKIYLVALSQRFEIHVKARGQGEPQKILTHIHKQCLSLIDWITQGEPFHAWRTR